MRNMATFENPAEEVKHLQRSMGDLVNLAALPAMWIGGDWLLVTEPLLDALLGMLRVNFVCVLLMTAVAASATWSASHIRWARPFSPARLARRCPGRSEGLFCSGRLPGVYRR